MAPELDTARSPAASERLRESSGCSRPVTRTLRGYSACCRIGVRSCGCLQNEQRRTLNRYGS
jgi:hypothetical protein